MTQMTCDPFCSIAPQPDPFLCINHADTSRQAFKDAATDFRIVKPAHGGARAEFPSMATSAKFTNGFRSQGLPPLETCQERCLCVDSDRYGLAFLDKYGPIVPYAEIWNSLMFVGEQFWGRAARASCTRQSQDARYFCQEIL